METDKILVALDDSTASRRLLPIVAATARKSARVRLVLCHLLPALPPRLLESRGAEAPKQLRRVEHKLAKAQERWIAKHRAEAQRLMTNSKGALERHGVLAEQIQTMLTEPIHGYETLADAILEQAHTLGCGTVAVGRRAFPALREILETHLGDELQRRADGLNVWVVD